MRDPPESLGPTADLILPDATLVEGTVVSPSGEALTGLLVQGSFDANSSDRLAYTNQEGAFRIHVPVGSTVDLRVPGTSQSPAGAGYIRENTTWRGELVGVSAPASGLVIRVTEAMFDRALTVVVVDADGAPVESIQVMVTGPNGVKSSRTNSLYSELTGIPQVLFPSCLHSGSTISDPPALVLTLVS